MWFLWSLYNLCNTPSIIIILSMSIISLHSFFLMCFFMSHIWKKMRPPFNKFLFRISHCGPQRFLIIPMWVLCQLLYPFPALALCTYHPCYFKCIELEYSRLSWSTAWNRPVANCCECCWHKNAFWWCFVTGYRLVFLFLPLFQSANGTPVPFPAP